MYNIITFEEKVNSITKDKNKVLEFNGVKAPVKFICLSCGRSQEAKRGEVLLRKGKKYQCQFCHTPKEIVTKSNYWKILKAAANSKKELLKYTNTSEAALFKCQKCGSEFSRQPLRFLKNQSCPVCEARVESPTLEMVKQRLLEIGNFTLVKEDQYKNLHSKILLRHDCGFVWSTKLSKVYNGATFCPKCSKRVSRGERAILGYLDEHNIDYVFQWKRNIEGHNLYFDFYLPDNNMAIEFQGEQHYAPVDWFGGQKDYETRIQRDNYKKDWCQKNNIKLLEISWKNFENIHEILEAQRLTVASSEAKRQISQEDNDIV